MIARAFVLGTALCTLAAACGSSSKPAASTPAPEPAPAATPVAPAEPAPAPEPVAAVEAPPARQAPPLGWQQIGHRADGDVVMGAILWTGGDAFQVEVMGSMKFLLQDEITRAIQENPDDPGGAIQGVLDRMNEMSKPMMEWVPAKVN
ncbi:MAG TPA: hypothetical protein VM261_33095 [Kofleriaceae bacterium]|nr:hypothetical protein [Kofleriaceae bacterium]